jgi:RNA polymerase sigma factor (sigma-70 family)
MEAHSLPRAGAFVLPRSRRLLAAFGDDRLVDQVRRGNDAAFEALYDRHHRAILSFCRHMLASVEEAEDAVQHTFAAAYESIRSSDRGINLKPWLFTIARNRCLSILRTRREQAVALDDVPTAGLSGDVQRRSELRDVLQDIRELPDDQRAALVLSELGDLSHGDIALVVGCEVAKVKSLVFQARASLIESRKARDTSCQEIREQLATLHGAALRRGTLRRHVKHCPGCAQFRDELRRQRAMVAAVLPVIPSAALRHSALAAAGIGGGTGAAAGGGAVVGGSGLSVGLGGAAGAAKVAAIVAATGLAVGGGIEVAGSGKSTSHTAPPSKTPVSPNASPRANGANLQAFPPASPIAPGHLATPPGQRLGQTGTPGWPGKAHQPHGNNQHTGQPRPLGGGVSTAPGSPRAGTHANNGNGSTNGQGGGSTGNSPPKGSGGNANGHTHSNSGGNGSANGPSTPPSPPVRTPPRGSTGPPPDHPPRGAGVDTVPPKPPQRGDNGLATPPGPTGAPAHGPKSP